MYENFTEKKEMKNHITHFNVQIHYYYFYSARMQNKNIWSKVLEFLLKLNKEKLISLWKSFFPL